VSGYGPGTDDPFDPWDPDDAGRQEAMSASECASCPVAFLRDLGREAQPEVTLHLLAAARELLLAMETVVRAAEATVQRNAGQSREGAAASTPPRVRRIDIA
jgi:hypothetical protein